MNQLTPEQVNELLRTAGPDAAIYLVGAGGCGMSGLAHLLLDLGHRVAGSDVAVNEDVRELRTRGAEIHAGHAAANLAAARPCLVVYSSAIRRDNPELQAATQQGIPIVRRAVLLAALLRRRLGICVAGMHGKTTTAALLACTLEALHANPSYAVGARVPQLPRHARFAAAASPGTPAPNHPADPAEPTGARRPHLFVVEADESDGTLREFHPDFAILLNVDEEHLDYYANLEAVCAEFRAFAGQTRRQVIFCADDARLAEVLASNPRAISYGFHPLAGYRLANVRALNPGQSFEVWRAGEKLGEFTLALLGEKNVANAGAVVALLHQLGYPPAEIARALAGFTGAARRQQELFRDRRFRLFDDYGHHPAEIEATLQALRQLQPRRLLVAFQPHRFTRTQFLLNHFATCFRAADRLWVTEIYAASEAEIPGVDGRRLAAAIQSAGQPVEFAATLGELRSAVRAAMQPGDLVLFLGAGDITHAAHELAAELRQEPRVPREQLAAELTARLSPAAVVRPDEPLARRTTLRVGGPADCYVEPASEADLAAVLKFCAEHGVPFTLLGRGSNLLVRDGGIRGVVICLAQPHFNRVEVAGNRLHCGAGARLKAVSTEARRHDLSGLEFLEGIPGSVGGALRMNAGAMGSWMFEVVESVRFMDYAGQAQERKVGEVYVEYRGCPLFKTHIALGAVLKGEPASKAAIAERVQRFNHKRWESQPAAPSAGCIFKNPLTVPAGKLIDELGLKGTRVGGAVVSDVHGNFIVNDGQATAQDVLTLIELIRQRARAARGIELETEVEILGE